MARARLLAVLGITALASTTVLAAPSAVAVPGPPFSLVVGGLTAPAHLAFGPGSSLYVADLGSQEAEVAPRVVKVDLRTKAQSTALRGPVAGIDVRGNGNILATFSISGPTDPNPTELVRTNAAGSKVWHLANLLQWELDHNPDGQSQNAPDSRSNPYSVLALGNRTIVADAGANDLIEVRANGHIRTLTVFPTFEAPGCGPNNNGDISCDPVPTDVELGPDGYLYVSGLGAEVLGHVYKVDPTSGAIVETWDAPAPLTGVAVAPDGTIYAASVIAGFNPHATATVFKNDGSGWTETFVPVPTDVEWGHGHLYAASFAGAVFDVNLGSFH